MPNSKIVRTTALTVFVILFALFWGMNYLSYRTGDRLTPEQAVREPLELDRVYNSLNFSMRDMKLALYGSLRPEIVIMGSSRSMQFRDYFFSRSAMTLGGAAHGGAISYPVDILTVWKDILDISQPSVVVLQLDYWRYTGSPGERRGYRNEVRTPVVPIRGAFLGTNPDFPMLRYLSLDLGYLETFLNAGADQNTRFAGPLAMVGANAIRTRSGILHDGSIFDLRDPPLTERFFSGNEVPAAGSPPFQEAREPDHTIISNLREAILEIESAGTEVFVIFPPMAPAALSHMEDERYRYVEETMLAVEAAVSDIAPVYVAHSASAIGAPACEFIDESHGGEVAYARMLLQLSDMDPDGLGRHLNVAALNQAVENWPGSTVTPLAFQDTEISAEIADLVRERFPCAPN